MRKHLQAGITWVCRWLQRTDRASEVRYRELFENVPDGVYESSPDGRILAANAALVRMLGYGSSRELIEGINARQLYVAPEQRDEFQRILETQGSLQNVELELVCRDGRRITVLENARVLRDQRGGILYYQGTMTDITERKAAERELMRARDQAVEASRLKSQFLANMSHELRTPLNAVVGMSSLLVESQLDARQREYAETVLHSARFLMEIIGELLDFSRIEAGRLELETGIYRLRGVVEDATALLASRAAGRGVELICDIQEGVPELVAGDGGRLQQILTNLIGNAVKFTESGDVVVTVKQAAGGKTRFEVADSGIGIDEQAMAIIFEPFRQADGSTTRKHGGTGLGLSIARQIVERMGGQLECASQPGVGSTFWFDLVLAPAPACRAGRAPAVQPLRGKRVLLQEPNGHSLGVLRRWLESWGMVVVEEASNTDEFDICIVAGEADAPGPCRFEASAGCLAAGRQCLRLLPFGQSSECAGSAVALRDAIWKPVRELDLLDALLRLVTPPREDTARSLLPLSEKLSEHRARMRILAAEDNAVNQRVITRMIERLGHDAHVVGDGAQALEALGREQYDLILMDLQMPVMDGFQTTATVRRSVAPISAIPIIALTANAVQGDREQCLAAGMDDYLSKPIILEDLADVLERWSPWGRATAGQLTNGVYPVIE